MTSNRRVETSRRLLAFGAMKEQFGITMVDGSSAVARLERHNGVCWRYVIFVGNTYAGDVLFEHESMKRVELRDINVFPEYRNRGLGSGVLRMLIEDWRASGFQTIIGLVVAHDGAKKDRLCLWYERLGAEVVREDDRQTPSYAGKLIIHL